jgi:hypothetical protein
MNINLPRTMTGQSWQQVVAQKQAQRQASIDGIAKVLNNVVPSRADALIQSNADIEALHQLLESGDISAEQVCVSYIRRYVSSIILSVYETES